MFNKFIWIVALCCLTVCALAQISSPNEIFIDERSTTSITVSANEQTRIVIAGGQLQTIIGKDIYEKEKNRTGVISVTPDEKRGELYLSIADTAKRGVPLPVFLKTEKATYSVLLIPKDVPQTSIFLKEVVAAKPELPQVSQADIAQELQRRTTAHVKIIKQMTLAMATDAVMPGVERRFPKKRIDLWKEALFVLETEYVGRAELGQRYSLKNISSNVMVMTEPELYVDGVISVAIEKHTLSPGETTNVFIVRTRAGKEQ